MEKVNYDEEEPIINYIYSFLCFKEYALKSYDLFEKESKMNNTLENIKSDFEDNNFENETNYIKDLAILSLLSNEDIKIKEAARAKKLDKIEKNLGLDLKKNLEEEVIFNKLEENILNLKNILTNNSIFFQLLSEKINNFMFDINKFIYLIIKMFKNKCDKKIEELSANYLIDSENVEKESKKIKNENYYLKNEINSLKQIIENNTKEMNEMKEKLILIKENSEKNDKRFEQYKIQTQKIIEDNKKEAENKIKEAENKIKEAENKIKETENKIQENKIQTQKIIEDNKKETENKIKEAENKIHENKIQTQKIIEENKKEAEKNYNELNAKYIKLMEINLNNIKIEEDKQKLFDSYSNRIIEVNTKNNELNNKIDKLNIDLDKKTLEIKSLKNYISVINLEIELNKKNN